MTTVVTETISYDLYEDASLWDGYDDEIDGSGDRTSLHGRIGGSQGVNNYENLTNSTSPGNNSDYVQLQLMDMAASAWREQLPPGTMESDIGHYLMSYSAFPVVRYQEKGPPRREWVSQ